MSVICWIQIQTSCTVYCDGCDGAQVVVVYSYINILQKLELWVYHPDRPSTECRSKTLLSLDHSRVENTFIVVAVHGAADLRIQSMRLTFGVLLVLMSYARQTVAVSEVAGRCC